MITILTAAVLAAALAYVVWYLTYYASGAVHRWESLEQLKEVTHARN